ncbi:phage tail protein [Brevundimonas sp. UBA7664]|uniref:phage tail protein n=1 Tax=Brevundimonas sp. UBA7664 TaxID=1946141 RepID=UPI0025C6BEBB|nr:phage tail protein [Brevundimonas sp. UBA7664]
MMLSLGMFVFSLPTLAYQDLQRSTAWRHADTSRVGARAANQFLGPGADTITLGGVLVPDVAGDPGSIAELREMGEKGGPWALVDGRGNVMGAWVIESLTEGGELFFQDGVPRKTDFSLSLKHVDEPAVDESQPASSAA